MTKPPETAVPPKSRAQQWMGDVTPKRHPKHRIRVAKTLFLLLPRARSAIEV